MEEESKRLLFIAQYNQIWEWKRHHTRLCWQVFAAALVIIGIVSRSSSNNPPFLLFLLIFGLSMGVLFMRHNCFQRCAGYVTNCLEVDGEPITTHSLTSGEGLANFCTARAYKVKHGWLLNPWTAHISWFLAAISFSVYTAATFLPDQQYWFFPKQVSPYVASQELDLKIEAEATAKGKIAESVRQFYTGVIRVGESSDKPPFNDPSKLRWLGTGFTVDSACTFVTAKHILDRIDKDRIVIRFRLPSEPNRVRTVPANLLYVVEDKDIAFLKVDKVGDQPCRTGNLHIFHLSHEKSLTFLNGAEIMIIGYPQLTQNTNINIDIPVVRKGIISSTEIKFGISPMLLLDLLGVPGFSGSPVILWPSGEAVGVILGPGPTQRLAGFEWATPVTVDDYHRAQKRAVERVIGTAAEDRHPNPPA